MRLEVARLNLASGYPDDSCSRSYFATFEAASAATCCTSSISRASRLDPDILTSFDETAPLRRRDHSSTGTT